MAKKYVVKLTLDQRAQLERVIRTGEASARKINRAHILLKADTGDYAPTPPLIDHEIAQALDTSEVTVQRVRRTFCLRGLEAATERAPTTRIYERTLDGRAEAHLIALACSQPPAGRARWTVRLLADKMVELDYVEDLSRETVRRALKKMNSSPT